MIHDASVEVTCDADGCNEYVAIQLRAGARDTYLARDSDIEDRLTSEHDWIVRDGKHYCSDGCAGEP